MPRPPKCPALVQSHDAVGAWRRHDRISLHILLVLTSLCKSDAASGWNPPDEAS